MPRPLIIIDTNVLVAALRSSKGASSKLLNLVGSGNFKLILSVPLAFEYEDVLHRPDKVPVSSRGIDAIIDYICQEADQCRIFYLWRPVLKDPKDDMVLELAINSGCDYIVTHNTKDFLKADKFKVKVVTPFQFMGLLEE